MYKSHLHLHIPYTYMLLQWHVNAHYYIKVAISWICTHIYNGIWAYINRKDYWSRVGTTVGAEAELNLILQLKRLCSRNWVLSQSKVLVSGKTSTLAKYLLLYFNLFQSNFVFSSDTFTLQSFELRSSFTFCKLARNRIYAKNYT